MWVPLLHQIHLYVDFVWCRMIDLSNFFFFCCCLFDVKNLPGHFTSSLPCSHPWSPQGEERKSVTRYYIVKCQKKPYFSMNLDTPNPIKSWKMKLLQFAMMNKIHKRINQFLCQVVWWYMNAWCLWFISKI